MIQVGCLRDADLRITGTKWNPLLKSTLTVIEVNITLSAITIRNDQIDVAVAVHVCRRNRGCIFMGKGKTVGIKLSFAFIEADVIRALEIISAVCHQDVW